MENKLKITKKVYLKGDDGYRTFSVRVREATIDVLDSLAADTGHSRNELINIILEYGIKNIWIDES